jgi:FixJ family two-component response regulator
MKPATEIETKESLISIVDDEACVRESLSSLIRSVGYRAKEYASAEEFLTWGWWDNSACLVLDIRLPGMGGLELQRYLAERRRERPIVLISGHATGNDEAWAMMRGAVAFLRKPFSDESLLAAVGAAIGRRRGELAREDGSLRMLTCPLCQELFPAEDLPEHIDREQTSIRDYTIQMIKTLHPEWVKEDGSCARCWRFYAGLGRVVSFAKNPSPAKTRE